MDDDAFLKASLEEIVRPTDSLLLTVEGNPHITSCYQSDYFLSIEHMQKEFNRTNSTLNELWGGKTLVNWAMFAAPRHPLLLTLMQNIVTLVRREYLRQPTLKLVEGERRSKQIICGTGPGMLTSTAVRLLLEHEAMHGRGNLTHFQLRVEMEPDFRAYGGVWKASAPYFPPNIPRIRHYSVVMEERRLKLLGRYAKPRDEL
jgi:hypothetical protein